MIGSIVVGVILLAALLWVIRSWTAAMRKGGLPMAMRLLGESLGQIFGGQRFGR